MTNCLSTHGASGYAPGSHKDGDAVICGSCGARIENPRPTGYIVELWTFADVLRTLRAYWRAEAKTRNPVWKL